MLSSQHTFWYNKNAETQQKVTSLLSLVDLETFNLEVYGFFLNPSDQDYTSQWHHFCNIVKEGEFTRSEKLMISQTAFRCLQHSVESNELTQLVALSGHLKRLEGVRWFTLLFSADVPERDSKIQYYLLTLQLLIDLYEQQEVPAILKKHLPNLSQLIPVLQELHQTYLAKSYPVINIDATISRFAEKNELIQFPLSKEELALLKEQYGCLKSQMDKLKTIPDLRSVITKDYTLLAVLAEAIRRTYKIMPYDTQMLSLLAFINTPEKLKGRIAQIKTGEGKSTIIAMLTAYRALHGEFVDVITSSSYLAMRDCEKYKPFYALLGLTASHISHPEPEQYHFHAQILYGTNTDFEFAMLRDGLNHTKLRYTKQGSELKERLFQTVIVDEVDNLFLDTALNSARLAVQAHEDISFIYAPILNYIKQSLPHTVDALREYLFKVIKDTHHDILKTFTDARLCRWLESARTAWYDRKENYHYLVKEGEIVIIDYANTGRLNEGSAWQHGLHQFLQAKHNLIITSESLTAASMSHPTYFNLYQHIYGLTGTMGEAVEREEIQKIYNVDSFDVPPYLPSQRQLLPHSCLPNQNEHFSKILADMTTIIQAKRPVLVLFKTVLESNQFSEKLLSLNMKHQLINETQRESEDYLILRAGYPGAITVATNTAGRGTDILLAPESKAAGGLHVIFTFYPDNVRVEAQGYGRAGRQGQPGSCVMILSHDDDGIRSLLNGSRLESIMTNDFLKLGAGLSLINYWRSEHVAKQSLYRYHCSQQEMVFFAKLQIFFNRMKEAQELVHSNYFKNRFITACQLDEKTTAQIITSDVTENPWASLIEVMQCLKDRQSVIPVDWSGFYDQFMRMYLSHIRHEWAIFYSKLQDDVRGHQVEDVRKQQDALYAQTSPLLQAFMLNPQEGVINCLHSLKCQLEVVSRPTLRKS